MTAPPFDIEHLAARIRAGDRAALGRAVTLIESKRSDHDAKAHALLQELLPHTGGATRIGITGLPGAGKSTLIDTLGRNLTGQGHKVAVLAVDPSSRVTGGSILGDKTRMSGLAVDPTPSSDLRRRARRSAGSPGAPARPCCCAKRPASMW
jgi:LAO/AO transport system kinase